MKRQGSLQFILTKITEFNTYSLLGNEMSRRIILKLADQPLIGQQETAETVATKIISADFINQSVYVTLNLHIASDKVNTVSW